VANAGFGLHTDFPDGAEEARQQARRERALELLYSSVACLSLVIRSTGLGGGAAAGCLPAGCCGGLPALARPGHHVIMALTFCVCVDRRQAPSSGGRRPARRIGTTTCVVVHRLLFVSGLAHH
jgi:hypothetical protein